jgi:signal transduction histidine kinase
MLATILLVLGVLFTSLVCVIVLLNNHKTILSKTLLYIGIALMFWETANYLADIPSVLTIVWNRATFLGPLFVFLFSDHFVAQIANRKHNTKRELLYFGITIIMAFLCMTGLVIAQVDARMNDGVVQGFNVERGAGYSFVIIWILFLMIRFIGDLVRSYIKAEGKVKKQLQLVIIGVISAVSIGITTNLLLPIVSGNTLSTQFAPLAGIAFTSLLAIAIIRHGLFNVRLLVIRALGYALSLIVVSSIYGFIVFGIARYIFDLRLSTIGVVTLSVATGIASLLFNKLKAFFDRMSRRLFYQDAYDSEELFNEYNRVLVSTIDLDLLLKRTSQVIADYLKIEYCLIGVKDGSEKEYRIVGADFLHINRRDIESLRSMTVHVHKPVIDADELLPEMVELQTMLQKYKISVLARLTTNIRKNQEGLGYLALGPKKSGNPYTSQDIKVIETLANELIIALQNALRFEEIERFNETLQQKVQDATMQLRESNKKLKQLNESKDDFIGMASHQLRTPLTSAKGYISLVMDGDAGKISPTQQKLLQQAFNSSQKMVYLIADLLNVSRLKTGKFVIERSPVRLDKMIDDEMDQLQEEADGRGLELTFAAPKDFPTLPLDETKTRQVIMNFLDNAIYYTPSGGHIHVELTNLPKSIEFKVVDDGIGVPKDERHRLFTKFYRARNAQRARPDGTGLGLWPKR